MIEGEQGLGEENFRPACLYQPFSWSRTRQIFFAAISSTCIYSPVCNFFNKFVQWRFSLQSTSFIPIIPILTLFLKGKYFSPFCAHQTQTW